MKLEITEEDIETAYKNHHTWWLDPSWTPIAVAMRRVGVNVRVGYSTLTRIDGWCYPLPAEAFEYQVAFGFSLYDNLDPHRASVIKKLHETNSSFATAVAMPKKADRVKPIILDLEMGVI